MEEPNCWGDEEVEEPMQKEEDKEEEQVEGDGILTIVENGKREEVEIEFNGEESEEEERKVVEEEEEEEEQKEEEEEVLEEEEEEEEEKWEEVHDCSFVGLQPIRRTPLLLNSKPRLAPNAPVKKRGRLSRKRRSNEDVSPSLGARRRLIDF